MSTPLTLKDLNVAIERLRPELPKLLGPDCSAFTEELDSYLHMGSVNRLWDLFGRYPAAHNRLLNFLPEPEGDTTKGNRLFGRENITLPYHYYRCESGPHVLVLRRVEKRDAADRALCPQHYIAMSLISSEDLRAAIERLRPKLPQLLGTNHSAFVTKLDNLLRGGSDDELSQLFEDHPAAYERLLHVLA